MSYIIKILNEEDVIIHYGVKGMRWGIRKNKALAKAYRNNAQKRKSYQSALQQIGLKKGSVMDRLIDRAASNDIKTAEKFEARAAAGEKRLAAKQESARKSNPRTMTEAELNSSIKRMELERRYNKLEMESRVNSVPAPVRMTLGLVSKGVSQGVTEGTKNFVSQQTQQQISKMIYG